MTSQNNAIDKFVKRHAIRILNTNKRASRINRLNYDLFVNPANYNEMNSLAQSIAYETEPLYTVEIAESELDRLAKFEQQVFNNMEDHGHLNLFEVLMRQKEEESRLKESYPAVKKAYEHYSLLLNLAKSGKI